VVPRELHLFTGRGDVLKLPPVGAPHRPAVHHLVPFAYLVLKRNRLLPLKISSISRSRGVAFLGELVGLEAALLSIEGIQHVRHQHGRRLLLKVTVQDELSCYFLGGHLCKSWVAEDSFSQGIEYLFGSRFALGRDVATAHGAPYLLPRPILFHHYPLEAHSYALSVSMA
jgi:hypothetical protein